MRFQSYAEVGESGEYALWLNPANRVLVGVDRQAVPCPAEEEGCGALHVDFEIEITERSDAYEAKVHRAERELIAHGDDPEDAESSRQEMIEDQSPSFLIYGPLEQIAFLAASLTHKLMEHDAEVYAAAMDVVIENAKHDENCEGC